MNKLIITFMSALMLFITVNVYAEDNGGLPEIAAYDDESIELLTDKMSVNEMIADASDAMPELVTEGAIDNSGLPEIAAYDDSGIDALPATVSAQ